MSYKYKTTKAAFHWIVNILRKTNIPFQIAGGLAANLYGANRPLEDIDIDIPEEYFLRVKDEVKNYIVYGPAQFKDETWDLMLMTLDYQGQLIDLGGAFNAKIFNRSSQIWQKCHANFSKSEIMKCFDLDVPFISKKELILYKTALCRAVDLIYIKEMNL